MTKLNRKSNGADVVGAGYAYAGATSTAITTVRVAVKDEGREVAAVRADFIVGVMAKQLAYTTAQARAAFEKAGKDSTTKADARRTDVEEAAYGAGRVAWSRVAKPAGVVQEKRGGARNVKKTKRAAKTAKPGKPVASPKVATLAEAQAHIRNMALMLSGFVAKNPKAFEGDGQPLSALVAEFVGNVNKLT